MAGHPRPSEVLSSAAASGLLVAPPLTAEEVRRWKNIPDPVRDAFVAMAAFCTQLAHATQTASVALQKKADATFVSEALAARASNEQLTELARFVQKDVMGRLDGPCGGHGTLQKTLMQVSSRMGALEAVVSAQDTLIQHLQRELHDAQKARAREGEAVSPAVRAHVEAALAQATAPLAAEQGRLEAALRAKVDMGGLELVVRDLHTLDAGLQARPTREEAADMAEERAAAAAAAAVTPLRLSTQQTVDGCLRSINDLRRAVESGGAGGGGEAASPARGDSSASAAPGPGGGFSGAAWKTKLAAVTAAFEGKLEASRGAVVEEAVRAVEGRLGEVVDALNKKAYKADVAKALAGKADAADVEALLAGKAERGETAAALKRKVDASELVAVKRALTDLGAAVLARSPAPSSAGASTASAAGIAAAAAQASSATAAALRDEIASLRRQVEAVEGRLAAALSSTALTAGAGGRGPFGAGLLSSAGAAEAVAAEAGELVQGLREELQAQLQRHASSAQLLQRQVTQLQGDVAGVLDGHSQLRGELEGVAAQLAERASDKSVPGAADSDGSGSPGVRRQQPHASGQHSLAGVMPRPSAIAAAGPPLPLAVLPSGVHGRWVWKSRCLDEATGSVLWDVEALNSAAGALRWGGADAPLAAAASGAGDENSAAAAAAAAAMAADPSLAAQVGSLRRSDVLAVRPGLYRVEVGFFAAQPPALTILVNGHPAVSTAPQEAVLIAGLDEEEGSAGTADASAPRSSDDAGAGAGGSGTSPGGRRHGDRADAPASAPTTAVLVGSAVLHRHPAGSVAGVSLTQFLALPARAVISLLHDGPVRGQGFLELAKL